VIRLAAFALAASVAWFLAAFVTGLLGVTGPGGTTWFGAIVAVALMIATAVFRRLDGERVWPAGPGIVRRRALECAAGFVAGASLSAAVAAALGASVGGVWRLNVSPSVPGIIAGLAAALCLMLAEELLFRGYPFRQLVRASGPRAAVVLSAAAFGAYHLVGSGYWAMGAVFRFLTPALGGLLFGYAALRTGSLALPIGLHWGGNWVQAAVLGLGQAAGTSRSLWVMTLEPGQQRVLAAPDLVPHLPYLLSLCCGFLLVRYVIARAYHPATT
jgi:membrane protease YdiL (CAAX protease family)